MVIGNTLGHLHQSEFFREVVGIIEGPPPEINLFNEKNNGLIIQKLISNKLLLSVHDISSGGILVALSEMCIAGKIGAKIKIPKKNISSHEYLFGEDQGRYIVEIEKDSYNKVKEILDKNLVHYDELGIVTTKDMIIDDKSKVSIDELIASNNNWLTSYMN